MYIYIYIHFLMFRLGWIFFAAAWLTMAHVTFFVAMSTKGCPVLATEGCTVDCKGQSSALDTGPRIREQRLSHIVQPWSAQRWFASSSICFRTCLWPVSEGEQTSQHEKLAKDDILQAPLSATQRVLVFCESPSSSPRPALTDAMLCTSCHYSPP